jgi:peptide/nickel transport system substrate-binding protein
VLLNGGAGGCAFVVCGGETNDPQIEGIGLMSYELDRCCLLRTLLSYNGQPTSKGGTILRPDLATELPSVSSDGLVWTFHLKRGLRYAPPLQRTEITAGDIVRSIERLLSKPPPDLPPPYGDQLDSYLGGFLDLQHLITGAPAFHDGTAERISGLETPNPFTLVVHLNKPNGGLGFLFALPSTAPIPANPSNPSARFGVAQGHARFYTSYLVASGPYMIEGADRIDFSKPPKQQAPASGDGPGTLTLVRNPSWRPSTDALRAAEPDRIVLSAVDNPRDGTRLIRSGALDVLFNADASPRQLEAGGVGAGTRGFSNPRDWVVFLDFNLAVPPLDDIHVRRAINGAISKSALLPVFRRAGLGGTPDTHLGLDSEENNLLLTFDPFHGPAADLSTARAEMARSRYDRDHDGRCDAAVCRGLVMIARSDQPGQAEAARVIARQLRAIGVRLRVETPPLDRFYATYANPRAKVPLRLDQWIKDLTSGATYFPFLFGSPRGGATSVFGGLGKMGATPKDLRKWGYSVRSVPSVDDRIIACLRLTFGAQTRCWADLDQYLMTQVVPWAPLVSFTTGRVVSSRVRSMSFDQSDFVPAPSLDRIVLAGSSPTPSPVPSGPVPRIPEGTYVTTISKADLYRFDPHYDPSGVDENTGTQTITLRGGWFEMISTADHPIFKPINVGTYGGTGHRVVFTTTAPVENAIATPPMRWTFDGHSLRFRFLGCGKLNTLDPHAPHLCQDIKVLYQAHPWVKVG